MTDSLAPDVADCIVAVDSRTGEAFVPLAYATELQRRIAELEAQIAQGTP